MARINLKSSDGNYIFYLDEMCLSDNGNPIKPDQCGLCLAKDDYGMYPISGWSDWGNPVTHPVSNSVISVSCIQQPLNGRIQSCPANDNYMYGNGIIPISGWSSRGNPVTQPVSNSYPSKS